MWHSSYGNMYIYIHYIGIRYGIICGIMHGVILGQLWLEYKLWGAFLRHL